MILSEFSFSRAITEMIERSERSSDRKKEILLMLSESIKGNNKFVDDFIKTNRTKPPIPGDVIVKKIRVLPNRRTLAH